MGKIKIACETYTWQMPGEQFKGKLNNIMRVVSQAGFAGIEPETSFFGSLEDPIKMKEVLEENHLELAALCHVEDWRNPSETEEEKLRADKWMEFLSHFPETIYLLVQMPGYHRKDLSKRQNNLLNCINNIAERASHRGISCSFHPNSPKGSIFRTARDYDVMIHGMKDKFIRFCPDVGHIAKGGMDPLTIIKQYRDVINLIHYKDMHHDGRWAETGHGKINFVAITEYLRDSGYEGWIIMEDECDKAIHEPDELAIRDGKYVKRIIEPLLRNSK